MLEVLNVSKKIDNGVFKKKSVSILRDISFNVDRGETLGLVGQSGCGKSTLAKIIAGIDKPSSGEVIFQGKNRFQLDKKETIDMKKDIQMIFQNPTTSFNPKKKMIFSLMEPIKIHNLIEENTTKWDDKVEELIELVGLEKEHLNRYPHELSGGQLQRFALGRVFSLQPKLILADEVTSMLDVSVQANILNLMRQYQIKNNTTIILISHDIEVIEKMCNKIVVMLNGEIVEMGDRTSIINNPLHAYTKELIENINIDLKKINDKNITNQHNEYFNANRTKLIEVEKGHKVRCEF